MLIQISWHVKANIVTEADQVKNGIADLVLSQSMKKLVIETVSEKLSNAVILYLTTVLWN